MSIYQFIVIAKRASCLVALRGVKVDARRRSGRRLFLLSLLLMIGASFLSVATPPSEGTVPSPAVLPDGTFFAPPVANAATPVAPATGVSLPAAQTSSQPLPQVTVEAVAALPSEATTDLSIDPARAAAYARLTKVHEACDARAQKLSLLKQTISEKGTALDLRLDSAYDGIGVARGALENDLKEAQGMLVTTAASGVQGGVVGPQELLAKARKDVDSLVQLGKKLTEQEQAVNEKIVAVSRRIDEALALGQTVTTLMRTVENREGSATGADEAQKGEDADVRASREFDEISTTVSAQIDELIRGVDATAAEVKVLQKTLDQEGVDVRALMKQWGARSSEEASPSEGQVISGAKKKPDPKGEGMMKKGRARTQSPATETGVPQPRRAKHSSLVDSASAVGDTLWEGARIVGAYLSRVFHTWYQIATERTTLFSHDEKEYYDPVLEQIRLEQNEAYHQYRALLHEEKQFQLKKELFDARERERREALSVEATNRDPVRLGSPCASWGDVLFEYAARVCALLVRFLKALL